MCLILEVHQMQEHHNLDEAQMEAIVAEMSIGLEQEHNSIIHCYRCWLDRRAHCINLITEFFTSGNLRDYRQRHKHLELKAVKKWARQVGYDFSTKLMSIAGASQQACIAFHAMLLSS
jgi:Protein tyrosine and serine/threonine kinase